MLRTFVGTMLSAALISPVAAFEMQGPFSKDEGYKTPRTYTQEIAAYEATTSCYSKMGNGWKGYGYVGHFESRTDKNGYFETLIYYCIR